MRRSAMIGALLLVALGIALGATVFRTDIAQATGLAQSVTVDNTAANPVPVSEQNQDRYGNIKVHEQGTADVNVTNSSLSIAPAVPITAGGLSTVVGGGQTASLGTQIATALSVHLSSEVDLVALLSPGGGAAAVFLGPDQSGNDSIVLTLARPVKFDSISCDSVSSTAKCSVSWVGAQP